MIARIAAMIFLNVVMAAAGLTLQGVVELSPRFYDSGADVLKRQGRCGSRCPHDVHAAKAGNDAELECPFIPAQGPADSRTDLLELGRIPLPTLEPVVEAVAFCLRQ